jgi:hypothetical protein
MQQLLAYYHDCCCGSQRDAYTHTHALLQSSPETLTFCVYNTQTHTHTHRGINQYIGPQTQGAALVGFLCCCFPGLLILLCPFDERDAYKVNGVVYDAGGSHVGYANSVPFVPKQQQPMAR